MDQNASGEGVPNQLHHLVTEFWEWKLQQSPEFATLADVHKYNDRLESLTADAYNKRLAKCTEFLGKLLSDVPITSLTDESDKLTWRLLKNQLDGVVEGYRWRHYSAYNAANFLENIPVDFSSALIDATPFSSVADFQLYLQRLQAIPRLVDEEITLMKLAMAQGTTLHGVSIHGLLKHFHKMLNIDPQNTPFFRPFKEKLPNLADVNEREQSWLQQSAYKVIREQVQPALLQQARFLHSTYLVLARRGLGVSTLRDGQAYYRHCLKWHLTLDIEPHQVHQLGIQEVARIRKAMDEVRKEVDFKGSHGDFVEFLRSDPQFYHNDKEQLLQEYRDIIRDEIEPTLLELFLRVPDIPVVVQEMTFDGPGGLYWPPSEEGSRPGVFHVNLQKPESKPRFSMRALCLHEASPGHHFQHGLIVREPLPRFRKELDYRKLYAAPFTFPMYTAYVEGWALYAEYLGEELGIYRTPYDMFGRYSEEILRACRMVVDTGLHMYGWSRQQAVEYMRENSPMPLDEIETEVNRYLTWPGQACAYKIGEMKILELRKNAEEQLGDLFDIREFHDTILKVGAVPLIILEEVVDSWIKDVGNSQSI